MSNNVFKSVEECIELAKSGVVCDTGFRYVFNMEETDFDKFDINGDIESQLEHMRENGDWMIELCSDNSSPFDEFTAPIVGAYLK